MKKDKEKQIPKHIVKLYFKLNNVTTLYADTCFIGYLTDDNARIKKGALISRYITSYNITPYVSNVVMSEISELPNELDDGKKLETMKELFLSVLTGIGCTPLNVTKLSTEESEFFEFLISLKMTKADALHFTIAVFNNMDAFLSFNKKILMRNKTKIDRKLMIMRKKSLLIFDAHELYKDLLILEEHGFI